MVKIEQTGGRLTEEEILHGKEDAYGIYQVNRKGAGRDYAFLSFDSLRSKGKVPERTEYQLVYSDILGADENRDSLFTKFNIAHPDDFTGHSRSREGLYRPDSDIDVALSYEGTISEDTFFNYLKEDMLYARNIPIDINPIRKEKSGTLSEYMQRAEYYLDEMEIKNFAIEVDSLARSYDNLYVYKTMSQEEAADAITEDILHKKSDYIKDFLKATEKSETESDVKKGKDMFIQMEKLERLSIFEREPETIPEVDFYVAECSEFPTLGEYYDGLTLAEAIAIYEKIPGERLNGVKGIGIDLHFPDDDMYSGKCDLLAGGRICREMLDAVPRYKENREVRKAVKYLENHFNKKEELSLSKPKKQEQAPRL